MIYSADNKAMRARWQVFEGEEKLSKVFSVNDETGELVEYATRPDGQGVAVEGGELKKTTRVCNWNLFDRKTGELVASWPPQ